MATGTRNISCGRSNSLKPSFSAILTALDVTKSVRVLLHYLVSLLTLPETDSSHLKIGRNPIGNNGHFYLLMPFFMAIFF